MLRSLHIENIAVIKDAEIEFHRGFTALTGETGAGKSMIIDGLDLLMGGRASKELIRTGAERASVVAMFTDIDGDTLKRLSELEVYPDEDEALFLSRTVSLDGGDNLRSQTKIGGHNAPAALGREVGRLLIDIHGQNDNQKLLDSTAHISFLDAYAENGAERDEYARLYSEMTGIAAGIKELRQKEDIKQYELDRAKKENAEIDSVKPKVGEEETLLENRKKLENLDRLKKQVGLIYKALYSSEKGVTASYLIERAGAAFDALEGVMPDADKLSARLEEIKYELEDIAERAHSLLDGCDGDPTEALDRTEERLDKIERLKRKYGETVEEVLLHRKKNAETIEALLDSENRMAALAAEYTEARGRAIAAAKRLSETRRQAGKRIEAEILDTLRYLDMKNIRFSAEVKDSTHPDGQIRLQRSGCDEMEFLISTNPGEPLMPLSRIASGGELSRIMLALKSVLTDRAGTDTVVYDEIDTGISGSTSQKIGVKLKEIAEKTQVFCVTHSAQIAALADKHCLIRKDEINGRAETAVSDLEGEDRVRELARIIGGVDLTEKTLDAARDLMEFGRNTNK